MELEVIIGLEVHVQLKTKTKIFCACANITEDLPPNTAVCPVCMGHPGTLPVLNGQAVRMAVKAALALECTLPDYTKFDRKHYFYPDLPKAYQISQFDRPVGLAGHLNIVDPATKIFFPIRINRVHLEEDAAKNTHIGNATLVNYNRGGTPLIEIVSEADMRTPEQAKAYLQEIRLIMRYIGVSDADMEKGQLRCDANVSLRPFGDENLYPKTEIKNINSFNYVAKAIEYEISRQTQLWLEGDAPKVTSTRGWDNDTGTTEAQRTKEEAADYRYFPEPDIPSVVFDHEQPTSACKDLPNNTINIPCLQAELPELPQGKRNRFAAEYDLNIDDILVLVNEPELAKFLDNIISELAEWVKDVKELDWNKQQKELVQLTVNWMINRLGKLLVDQKITLAQSNLTGENFAELILLLATNKINSSAGQQILELMVTKGGDASQIMIDHNLAQISDAGELEKMADDVILANPKSVEDYKAGKEKALMSLIGQIMAKTKGKANPELVKDIIIKKLS